MMRLVITLMTKEKIAEENRTRIEQILSEKMASKSETFDYQEEKFFELDIDLLKVEFSKETIYEDIDRLINSCEQILSDIQSDIDFIIANDDTSTEVDKYVKNWHDIDTFGLFITQRVIPNTQPYYHSQVCNAYLNFDYVSFDCMF